MSTVTRNTLLSLPNELIVDICEELTRDPDVSELHTLGPLSVSGIGALAATCKRLRVIAWPMSFSRLRLSPSTFKTGAQGAVEQNIDGVCPWFDETELLRNVR